MAERPSAREAVGILRQRFGGFTPTPLDPEQDDSTIIDDPVGAVALSSMRGIRAGELADRLDREEAASLIPQEGYVQGEPGRRMRSNADVVSAFLTRRRLHALGGEAATDPFTGQAERDRVRDREAALDEAATTRRSELTDAADAEASRAGTAARLKAKGLRTGEFEAAASPAALEAAQTPMYAQTSDVGRSVARNALEDEAKKRMLPSLQPGQMPTTPGGADDVGGGFTAPANLKPPNAQTERTLADMRMVVPLVEDLQKLLDPTKDSVMNAVANRAEWGLYKLGVLQDPKVQARDQLASLISVAGATPYMRGTRAFQYLKEVQKHLTDPKATDAFIYRNIEELKQQWPRMYDEILKAHYNPTAPLTFGSDTTPPPAAPVNDRRDPNRGL